MTRAVDTRTVRIFLLDDTRELRHRVRRTLTASADFSVVGEADDPVDGLPLIADLQPDIVVCDLSMPRMDGLEATRRLVAEDEDRRILILTTFDRNEYVYETLRAGASGFVLKDTPGPQLVAGIRAVSRGEALLAPAITRRLIEEFTGTRLAAEPPGYDELTPRERDVLDRVARGLSNAEIAAELVVSQATVKSHVAGVLSKLGLRDRVQAVVLAYETGLVRPGG